MRLVTFNLLHGRSLTDGLVDGDRLADAVGALDADVVGMQEVDRSQPRSGGLDLTAIAARGMSAVDWRFEPALVGTPGGAWRDAIDGDHQESSEPMYGVGLASRLPVRSWHVVRLAKAPVRSPVLIPGMGRRVIWLPDEPRIGLAAVIDTPAGRMTVATAHLSFVPGWGAVQLRRLVQRLRSLPAPRILLGDLNMPGGLPRMTSGWRTLVAAKTYPGPAPRLQFDHILGEGPLPDVMGGRAVPMPLSDHRALIVDLADVTATLR